MLSDTVFNSIRTSFPWIISISLIVYIAIHNDSRFSYANAVGSFDFFNATEYNENETSTQVMLSTESPCHIQRHVVFLKTYKTGSETMAGIFRRFAAMQNLSIVMSTLMGGHIYNGRIDDYKPLSPDPLSVIGWGRPGAHYEVLANHMSWNSTFIETTFPSDTKKITILRDPVTLLASSWKYYYTVLYPSLAKHATAEDMVRHLNSLLNHPSDFYDEMMSTNMGRRRHTIRPQLFSFYGEGVFERNLPKSTVNQIIKTIDSQFDLVLIMEYFDIGLALLSIELCWPVKYLAYLKINAGKRADVTKKHYHEELIRVVNYPDFMLYEHFNNTFWEKVETIGVEKVESIAEEIRQYSDMYLDRCVSKWVKSRNWNNQLIDEPELKPEMTNSTICKYMVLWGNKMSEEIKKLQYAMVDTWY